MAGFLDKETRIIDMTLTGYGKSLLSRGALRFVYFVPFDDEVDYDPVLMNSASLTSAALTASIHEQIEFSLIEEAKAGYRILNASGSDNVNVKNPLFTMAQGQHLLPRMTMSDGPQYDIDIDVKQQKESDLYVKLDQFGNTIEKIGPIDRKVLRFDASNMTFGLKYSKGSFPQEYKPEGFLVRMFRSGSDGITEIDNRRDSGNNITFGNDLTLVFGDD